jgi:dTDP-4-dehydrorhamnose reductase
MNLPARNRDEIELWGGVECTLNRVGDRFIDQLALTGHDVRLADLDTIAAAGLRTLRYPVLWESVAPRGLEHPDWRFADERLDKLRELAIEPIVGLLHHGSGPAYTHLGAPDFALLLAQFAKMVAERYPWVRMFTPVNEPLTTARFCGLYGHWYPHERDDRRFLRMLLNQVRGISASMRAIREVIPGALLIQTEDGGRTYSEPRLEYQAAWENDRRWLSYDLLFGRVVPGHPLWPYLLDAGADPNELEAIAADACPPDVVGLNYYVTSDRFLDGNVKLYPEGCHGGNRHERYADVEAARVGDCEIYGHEALLEEAWSRYRTAVALTEVHIGSTREEQLRWLNEAWEGARRARARGADVRAVTVWSLCGSTDWDSLVTRPAGHYESGALDARGPRVRPTALLGAVRDLTSRGVLTHPLAGGPGWWRRPERVFYRSRAAVEEPRPLPGAVLASGPRVASAASPVLILGAQGTLGRAFVAACAARAIPYRAMSRQELDITDMPLLRRALEDARPWAVLNSAGFVRVDDAEHTEEQCFAINAVGAETVALACAQYGVKLVTFSSDLVFDGAHRAPYIESSRVGPLSVYGRSKVEAERRVLATAVDALVVRTAAFFCPSLRHGFLGALLESLSHGRPFRAADDVTVSPTFVPDLVAATLELLIDGAQGVWHLANEGEYTWAELAVTAARLKGSNVDLVRPCSILELGLPAARPRYSALASERADLMPTAESALARWSSA